jgi:hypothetical protein
MRQHTVPILVQHRANEINTLNNLANHHGAEIDLRTKGDTIVVTHDLHSDGEPLSEWLKSYSHKLLVLNVKEDSLENEVYELLRKNSITEYFFLDQSFPTYIKSLNSNLISSMRVSEYELPKGNLGHTDTWIWLDNFTGQWDYDKNTVSFLKNSINRICLVSSELQGRQLVSEIQHIRDFFHRNQINLDAICTKETDLWDISSSEDPWLDYRR